MKEQQQLVEQPPFLPLDLVLALALILVLALVLVLALILLIISSAGWIQSAPPPLLRQAWKAR